MTTSRVAAATATSRSNCNIGSSAAAAAAANHLVRLQSLPLLLWRRGIRGAAMRKPRVAFTTWSRLAFLARSDRCNFLTPARMLPRMPRRRAI